MTDVYLKIKQIQDDTQKNYLSTAENQIDLRIPAQFMLYSRPLGATL